MLLYAALRRALHYGKRTPDNQRLIAVGEDRLRRLRRFYWLDLRRLRGIHRFATEEFGNTGVNALNIHPESVPEWITDSLPDNAGYLVGNLGPGRMDFRFLTLLEDPALLSLLPD